jgi:segregation and condensation protein B
MVNEKSIEEIDNEAELEILRKVEAALFISGRYLDFKELVALTGVNPILLRKALGDLKDKHGGESSGMEIIENLGKWKMDVHPDFSWMVNKLATGSSEFSKAEQETLAVIAYKQPVKQSVVVKMRGNKAYDHVKNFVELGLINKKKIGHTAELTLTEGFHDYFSLEKTSDKRSG